MAKKKDEAPIGLKVADALDFPGELVPGIPKITILADREVEIFNFKGILEFEKIIVRVNTNMGIVSIRGRDFDIKAITDESITLCGRAEKIEIGG